MSQAASSPAYNRIILKMSGEALKGQADFGIDPQVLDRLAAEVKQIVGMGVQLGIVIGGGNIFRGAQLSDAGITRVTGDYMGMLATAMNALALRDALERADLSTRVLSAIPMSGIVDAYDHRKAIDHLKSGHVVIFAGGTGNPLITTDSAASLRAIEVEADILLKATTVDGVYDADPATHPDAKRFEQLDYATVLQQELAVMDLAAFCQCRDHDVNIQVFNIERAGALMRVVMGETEGTLISNQPISA